MNCIILNISGSNNENIILFINKQISDALRPNCILHSIVSVSYQENQGHA